MEIHHTHHPGHKKRWTEYLLEFFMLFLAVFLGFTAENIREHKVERHREREYVQGVVQNLKDDTAALNAAIPGLRRRIRKMDSLVQLSYSDLDNEENKKALLQFVHYLIYYTSFNANTATISQLKSGNLRLIKKDHAADSILKYDLFNSGTELQWEKFTTFHNSYLETYEEVFDVRIIIDTVHYLNGVITGQPIPPISADPEKRKHYFNKVVALRVTSGGYLSRLVEQLDRAARLLAYLQKTYQLSG